MSKKKVSYFYKPDISSYYYRPGHVMKPLRLKLTHSLLLTYGVYRKMDVIRPHQATDEEVEKFHASDYINFLKKYSPVVEAEVDDQMTKYNVGPQSDCPLFEGLYDFVTTCAGGSIEAAALINTKQSDICVNWAGGLHHAKKGEASGFCYVNDIVLCILELLKVHQRVLYLDIDIHHGDGVEEAFYTTDRVMTVSFHNYGDFFPGSGDVNELGVGAGKNYSVNYPLKDGLDDETFESVFVPVMQKVMAVYQPNVVVMCCGADSIVGDRLGCWNLSLKGHASAISFMKKYNVPLVLLGGGGYTPKNVARCWAYETALSVNQELEEVIPENTYSAYFKPGYKLHLQPDPDLKNMNNKEYLQKCTTAILEQLGEIGSAPSVQIQDVPDQMVDFDRYRKMMDELEEKDYDDEKYHLLRTIQDERLKAHVAEFYANDKDQKDVEMKKETTYKKGTECGGYLDEENVEKNQESKEDGD
eukprot:maker-scaffold_2-snap-gene-21.58-mRNA-1 protein AED:0.21 eAED:0.21 QI:118/1/1/1/1/1/2/424/471